MLIVHVLHRGLCDLELNLFAQLILVGNLIDGTLLDLVILNDQASIELF